MTKSFNMMIHKLNISKQEGKKTEKYPEQDNNFSQKNDCYRSLILEYKTHTMRYMKLQPVLRSEISRAIVGLALFLIPQSNCLV